MVKKSSKSIENRCTHCAIGLVLIGKPFGHISSMGHYLALNLYV